MARKLAKNRLFVSMVGLITTLSMVGVFGILAPLLAAITSSSIVTNNAITKTGDYGITEEPVMTIVVDADNSETLTSIQLDVYPGPSGFDAMELCEVGGETPPFLFSWHNQVKDIAGQDDGQDDIDIYPIYPDGVFSWETDHYELTVTPQPGPFLLDGNTLNLYVCTDSESSVVGHDFTVVIPSNGIVTSMGPLGVSGTSELLSVVEIEEEGGDVLTSLSVSDVPDGDISLWQNKLIAQMNVTGESRVEGFEFEITPYNGFNVYNHFDTFFLVNGEVVEYQDVDPQSYGRTLVYGSDVDDNLDGSYTVSLPYSMSNGFGGEEEASVSLYVNISDEAPIESYFDIYVHEDSLQLSGITPSDMFTGEDTATFTVVEPTYTAMNPTMNMINSGAGSTYENFDLIELMQVSMLSADGGVDILTELNLVIEANDGFDPAVDFATLQTFGGNGLIFGTTEQLDTKTVSMGDIGSSVSPAFFGTNFVLGDPPPPEAGIENLYELTLSTDGIFLPPSSGYENSLYFYAFAADEVTDGASFSIDVPDGTLENYGHFGLGSPLSSGVMTLSMVEGPVGPNINTSIIDTSPNSIAPDNASKVFEITLSTNSGTDDLESMTVIVDPSDEFDLETSFQTITDGGDLDGLPAVFLTNTLLGEDPVLDDIYDGSSYALVPSSAGFVDNFDGTYDLVFDTNADLYGAEITTTPTTYYLYVFIDEAARPYSDFDFQISEMNYTSEGPEVLNQSFFDPVVIGEPKNEQLDYFALIGYGPWNGDTVPRFAPVDFFFNEPVNLTVINDLDSYFSIEPEVAGEWEYYQEIWGTEFEYRVTFFPEDGYAASEEYTISVNKNVIDGLDTAFTYAVTALDHGYTTPDLDDNGSTYSFTVSASLEDDGGFLPPIVMNHFPGPGNKGVTTALNVINIEFDRDDMDASTFDTNTIYLAKIMEDGRVVRLEGQTVGPTSGTSRNAKIENFTLETNTEYQIFVSRDVEDMSGTPIVGSWDEELEENGPYFARFETGSSTEAITASLLGSNLDVYENAMGDIVDVPVFEVFGFSFSGPLDPGQVSTDNIRIYETYNSSVEKGLAVWMGFQNEFFVQPTMVLDPSTAYTIEFSGLTSASGESIDDISLPFVTGGMDNNKPNIVWAEADNYGVYLEFSEAMNQGTAENKSNYSLKTRDSQLTSWSAADGVSLTSSNVRYMPNSNELKIDGLSLAPGEEFRLTLNSSITDLAGNNLNTSDGANVFVGYINDADVFEGGTGNAGMDDWGFDDFDKDQMFNTPVNINPMTSFVGATTKYFVDIPIENAIPDGSYIVIEFPSGFDVTGVTQDEESPVNEDFNHDGPGTITFASSDPAGTRTNGVDNDGIGVIGQRKIVIKLSGAIVGQDYLNLDLDGIINSTNPKGFSTDGFTAQVIIKTPWSDNGDSCSIFTCASISEAFPSWPFYITGGGDNEISGEIHGVSAGHSGTLTVYLDSPVTGPQEVDVTVSGDGGDGSDGTFTFRNLPDGDYFMFSDPNFSLSGTQYNAGFFAEPIWVMGGEEVEKNLNIMPENAAGNYALTVRLEGDFRTDGENDSVDIFAGSPTGFRVKTVVPGNTGGTDYTMYLPDGEWMVGIGPAMPEGPKSGPPQQPDWMPPMNEPVQVWSAGTEASNPSLTFALNTEDLYEITGMITDSNDEPVAGAHVWAYQPNGNFGGMGQDTLVDGTYTLKVYPGVYIVGAHKPGFPEVPEQSVEVEDENESDVDFSMKKPDYKISGVVKDVDGNNVPYAPVWAYQPDAWGHVQGGTDHTGNFILYVDEGEWRVEGDAPGVGWLQYSEIIIVDEDEVNSDNEITGIVLQPDASLEYYTISGTITVNGETQSYIPLRAVKYDSDGNYLGQEFGGNTNSEGDYQITVPAGIYRVDSWHHEYGELGLSDDGYPNSPANLDMLDSDVNDAHINFSEAELTDVNIVFTGSEEYEGFEAFVNVDGFNPETFFHTGYHNNKYIPNISDMDENTVIKLKDGDYQVFIHIPGLGEFMPLEAGSSASTPGYVDVGEISEDNNAITINLPSVANLLTVQGSVANSSDEGAIMDAWVWIHNPQTGYHNGTTTNDLGNFTLQLPSSGSSEYFIGSDKPGFMAKEPTELDIVDDEDEDWVLDTSYDFELDEFDTTISGYVFTDDDGGTAQSYDSGEEVSNGWVRAESADGSFAHAPVEPDGTYNLGVIDGSWTVWGNADGGLDTQYTIDGVPSVITIDGGSVVDAHIWIDENESWVSKKKSAPMTPASGGTVDDSDTDGTGVKLTIPANALGSSSDSGSVNVSNTSAVAQTQTASPFCSMGVTITAKDSNEQAITTLDSYIDLEQIIWKDDIDEGLLSGCITEDTLNMLLTMQMSYFDNSLNDWVTLDTTRKAYYKTDAGDSEWKVYLGEDGLSGYELFVNEAIVTDTFTDYADYKLVLTTKTDHLTIFSATTSNVGGSSSTPTPDPTPSTGNTVDANMPSTLGELNGETTTETTETVETGTTETGTTETTTEDTGAVEEVTTISEEVIADIVVAPNIVPEKPTSRSLEKETQAVKDYVSLTKVVPQKESEWKVINFLAYGSTDKTQAMPSVARKGLLDDYKAVYNRLPSSNSDWQNLAKVADGTTPSRVLSNEVVAIREFTKIFKSAVNFSNPAHEQFVHMLAYRLRPESRDLSKEQAGLGKYLSTYRANPSNGWAWSVLRSISYSGMLEPVTVPVGQDSPAAVVPGDATPTLPVSAERNLKAELVGVTEYTKLSGKAPSGESWNVVNYITYGSTDTSKALSSTERVAKLKSYRAKYGKLPSTEADWVKLAEIM
jgi:hypothetical protein